MNEIRKLRKRVELQLIKIKYLGIKFNRYLGIKFKISIKVYPLYNFNFNS